MTKRGQSQPVRDFIATRNEIYRRVRQRMQDTGSTWPDWKDEEYREHDAARRTASFKGHAPDFVQKFLDDAVEFGSLPAKEVRKRIQEVRQKATEVYADYTENYYESAVLKALIQRYIGWTLMTREAVTAIKQHKLDGPLYDVLAGTGYVAESLRRQGLKVYASDIDIKPVPGRWDLKVTYGKVARKNAVALAARFAKLGKPVNVIMSWPPKELPTVAMDLPKGSILFVMIDDEYMNNHHQEFLNYSYKLLGEADLVDSGASATWSGRVGRYNTLLMYEKKTESSLVESAIFDILNGTDPVDLIEYLL